MRAPDEVLVFLHLVEGRVFSWLACNRGPLPRVPTRDSQIRFSKMSLKFTVKHTVRTLVNSSFALNTLLFDSRH
jgi:hypothetical protein